MIGIVEDNLDPKCQGRLKVRIYGVTDMKDGDDYIIPTEMLPWAVPHCMIQGGDASGGGTFSVPKIGSVVYVDNSTKYPTWYANVYLSDEASSEISGTNYPNAHLLIYDTNLANDIENFRKNEYIKVFFTESKGFMIDYGTVAGTSMINIQPDGSINISNPNGDTITMHNGSINISSDASITVNAPIINLGEEAAEGVLKGETFKEIFDHHTHFTPFGPTKQPTVGLPPTCISDRVKV